MVHYGKGKSKECTGPELLCYGHVFCFDFVGHKEWWIFCFDITHIFMMTQCHCQDSQHDGKSSAVTKV